MAKSLLPEVQTLRRTLLRWRWNAGSGNLGVNQQVWINITATVRNGAPSGSLANDFTLDSDAPGLSLRCSGASQTDPLDLDEDAIPARVGAQLDRRAAPCELEAVLQQVRDEVAEMRALGLWGRP